MNRKTNNNHYVYLLFIFLSTTCIELISQENLNKDIIEASFLKSEIFQESDKISFNVVRVYNNSDSTIEIQPILDLPVDWAIFSSSFIDTIIQPHSHISLPFRFRSSANAKSDIEHNVSFKAFSKQKKILIETSFIVKLEASHSWDIIIPKKRVFFFPGIEYVNFEIVITNKGNIIETISLDIKPDKKIKIEGINGLEFTNTIQLDSHQDTVLRYRAKYSYPDDRVFDISKVQVFASTSEKKIFRSVLLEKYSDTYAPFEVDKTLSHETEFGARLFSHSNELLPFIRARGSTSFKNESTFRYNFTYYDITGYENIISNSYYNFLYTWDSFNAGIGAFSSQLGRNLYSRNCLMVSNEFTVNDNSSIKAYASYGLITPKTSIAAGYNYNNDKLDMSGSVAFDVDSYNNRNTASAVFNTGRIKIAKNHDLRLSLYSYQESYDVTNSYQQLGLAWDFSYYGKLIKNLSVQITNNYGSPNIPGPQMGLLNFYTKLKYQQGDTKNYMSLTYINSSRDYYQMDREGNRLPNIYLKDQYANLLFHNNSNKKTRWYIGPSIEYYSSSHPTPDSEERTTYDVDKYRMEFKGFFGRHLMLNVKYGLSNIYNQVDQTNQNIEHDFHVLGDYHNNGYGVRVAYDYGPMVNMGLYQYALDAGNNSINISPYMIKSYLKGRIGISMFMNYTHRFDLKYGSFNLNPKIETYIYKNWYVVIGGTYNYTKQSYGEFDSQNSFHYLELSIKKRWGKSDYYNWQKDLRRLKIQLFKDENGNGKMDRHEEGVSNVKVRITLTNTTNSSVRDNFPVDITLMSNEKGIVTFTRIPKGFYKATIIPLSDLQEYFYINSNTNQIELNKNASISIPFQKANKIVGKVELKRQRFTSESEDIIHMSNIKVTAYNKLGDSYSSFTQKDGSFTIYAPGNHVYHVRIKNVFGNDFTILNNDAMRELKDSISTPILIRVVENKRKIRFKKAMNPDHESPDLQKIVVLPGKIYENSNGKVVDIHSIPDFKITEAQTIIEEIITDRYYLVAGEYAEIVDAERTLKILQEQGIVGKIGVHGDPTVYYVTVDNAETRDEANKKLKNYRRVGLKPITIKRIKP